MEVSKAIQKAIKDSDSKLAVKAAMVLRFGNRKLNYDEVYRRFYMEAFHLGVPYDLPTHDFLMEGEEEGMRCYVPKL